MTERWRERLGGLDTVEPSPDLWDRATARSAEGPLRELPPARRRRVLAAAVAAVVAAAGLTGAFLAFTASGPSPGESGLTTYRDPSGTWEISYPDRFTQGTFPPLTEVSRQVFDWIWITNFGPPDFGGGDHLGGSKPSSLPDDGVMVEFYQVDGPLPPEGPDNSFPISLSDLKVIPGDYPGTWLEGDVLANGARHTISVRIMPKASQEDRQAAADIVASLRFLPVQEGTTIGHSLTFHVLGSPDAYPVGSVTRSIREKEEFAFYLVHVPGGFYALAWPNDFANGYKNCGVTYDPDTREFSCPNGAVWALDGSVIAKPGPVPDDPLEVLLVRLSLDGHILVSPNEFMHETSVDLRLTGGR